MDSEIDRAMKLAAVTGIAALMFVPMLRSGLNRARAAASPSNWNREFLLIMAARSGSRPNNFLKR